MVKGVFIEGHHSWEVRVVAMWVLTGRVFQAEGTVRTKALRKGPILATVRKPEYLEQSERRGKQ